MIEERKKFAQERDKNQEATAGIKEDLEGQIARLKAEHDEKVDGLENRLQVALGMFVVAQN